MFKIFMSLVLTLILFSWRAQAHDGMKHDASTETAMAEQVPEAGGKVKTGDAVEPVSEGSSMGPVEVGNKICPVSKEEINEESGMKPQKVEYKGKIYNLCCAMCAEEFNKDPDKYVQLVEEEMKAESATSAEPALVH